MMEYEEAMAVSIFSDGATPENIITTRKAIVAVFKDEEATIDLLSQLYIDRHAAEPDHDIYEHAEAFARLVFAQAQVSLDHRKAQNSVVGITEMRARLGMPVEGSQQLVAEPGFASEPHTWPCAFFWSENWTGGGYSGKPLERKPGVECSCWVDLGPEDL